MKFVRNTKYYSGEVYEWNLPTGTTCPFALECKVTVDRATGKFDVKRGQYRCYAANPERFPGVREHRWRNFDFVRNGGIPIITCKNYLGVTGANRRNHFDIFQIFNCISISYTQC